MKKYIRFIGLFVLFLILYLIDLKKLFINLSGINLSYLFLSIILNIPHLYFKSLRWNLLLRQQAIFYSKTESFLIYMSSLYIGFLTPGRLGEFVKVLRSYKPDLVLNLLHGRYGEDGFIQSILESIKIPYTHSGIKASKMAMDKPKAKSIFKKANILCPKGRVIDKKNLFKTDLEKYPVVVKPINSGSSVGVTIVSNKQMKKQAIKNLSKMDKKVLIEEFIPGHEIQVAVLGKRALGAIEIVPKEVFYDYKAKYFDKGSTKHLMPAPLSKNEYNKI